MMLKGRIEEGRAKHKAKTKKEQEESRGRRIEEEEKRIATMLEDIIKSILVKAEMGHDFIRVHAQSSYSVSEPSVDELHGDDKIIAEHFRNEGLKVAFFTVEPRREFDLDVGEHFVGGGVYIQISF